MHVDAGLALECRKCNMQCTICNMQCIAMQPELCSHLQAFVFVLYSAVHRLKQSSVTSVIKHLQMLPFWRNTRRNCTSARIMFPSASLCLCEIQSPLLQFNVGRWDLNSVLCATRISRCSSTPMIRRTKYAFLRIQNLTRDSSPHLHHINHFAHQFNLWRTQKALGCVSSHLYHLQRVVVNLSSFKTEQRWTPTSL